MQLDNNFIEVLRLQMQTDLQALIGSEATIRQEFSDLDDNYPCVILDITTGSSPSRHVGRSSNDIIHFDIYVLTIRPTRPSHIITCSDTVSRSGRNLAEYLAIKINNFVKVYRPVDNIIISDSQLVLNPDIPEREGIFKTIVEYEFVI